MPRRNSKVMTDPGIERMSRASRGERIERFDAGAPGLALRINDKGVKAWSVYYRLNGRHKRMIIGQWPVVGVAAAREQAREARAQAQNGIDPQRAREVAREAEAGRMFGTVAEEYIKRECARLRRGWEVERIIRREILPTWRERPIAELRKRDAIKLTDALIDAGKPAAAHRLFEIIRRIGRWAVKRDEIDLNPFADMDRPAPTVMRDRVLKPDEIKVVWRAWDVMGYPYGTLGKLLLTTAQRLNEVAQMKWSEIDHDNALWVIPGERTKSGREIELPLSSLVLEIIDDLPRFADGHYLLTTTCGRRPVSSFSLAKRQADKLVREIALKSNDERLTLFAEEGLRPWRNHDLRRTARTGLAELGVPQIVAEKVLNHAERNVLVKTYDQHEYANEKRDALERWAQRLREIIKPPPENVVKLTRAN